MYISEHLIMVILHFGAKKWFLNKNNFISQNYRSFTQTTVMGTVNILWKFELDQSIFLDFTGIRSLKYKEIRVSGAKLFWGVYVEDAQVSRSCASIRFTKFEQCLPTPAIQYMPVQLNKLFRKMVLKN